MRISAFDEAESRSQRAHLMAEILATEETYVDALVQLCNGYREPLLGAEVVIAAELHQLFGELPQLLDFHSRLLAELKAAWELRAAKFKDSVVRPPLPPPHWHSAPKLGGCWSTPPSWRASMSPSARCS